LRYAYSINPTFGFMSSYPSNICLLFAASRFENIGVPWPSVPPIFYSYQQLVHPPMEREEAYPAVIVRMMMFQGLLVHIRMDINRLWRWLGSGSGGLRSGHNFRLRSGHSGLSDGDGGLVLSRGLALRRGGIICDNGAGTGIHGSYRDLSFFLTD
jgi:hypothetical protein